MKRTARASSLAERYFTHLATPYTTADGKLKQPTSGRFIDTLRALAATYVPRRDLSACLAGTQPGFKGRVWFWSDLHLHHQMLVQRELRPFASVTAMNEAMLSNALARVGREDMLVFGGDITMGDVHETNAILRAIPGYKINVLGNHDIDKREVLRLAVDEVAPYLEFVYKGQAFFVSHYPVPEAVLNPGQIGLHGHSHAARLSPALGDGTRHINFCVENTHFAPVSLDWLLEQHSGRARV